MTKLYRIFKTQLVMAVLLLGAMFSYAQVVQVPANCRVVVTNTSAGGVLGFGGKVTDGGMVAMPDAEFAVPGDLSLTPNQGGKFTFNPPVTTITTASWLLKGDISNKANIGTIAGVIGNYNTVSQPPANLSAEIFSYNKSYRPNTTETSYPSFARSKGLVRVAYDQTGCGKSMFFEIFKTFKSQVRRDLPTIVGPSCLKPNTLYTYSVDRIVSDNTSDNIGFDSYYWTGVPASLLSSTTFYTSADTSSITFTTGTSVSVFTLQCCFGKVNPDTADGGLSTVSLSATGLPAHTTCVSKSIIVAPIPTFTTAPPTCLPTGTVATPAIITIAYPNLPSGTTYSWTAANTGWLDNATSSATVFTPVINSPTSGTTTLKINTAGNNNPGELTLTITGACDPAIFKYQINRSISAPIAIVVPPTSTNTFCIGSTSTNNKYTLSPTNSNSIQWYTDPPSVAGVTLQNATTSTVTIITTGAAVGSFKLHARSAIAACNTNFVEATINVQPATPQLLAGTPNCVVRSATIQVSSIGVVNVTGAVYNWLPLPLGVTCSNPAIANPNFTFNGTGASSTLTCTVVGANGCNSFVQKTVNYIAIAGLFPGGGFADTYLVNGSCGTVDSWTIGTGVSPTQLFTNYTVTSGNVSITNSGVGINNSCAISGTSGAPITSVCANLAGGITVCATTFGGLTQRLTNITNNETTKEIIEGVSIYPNPNNGVFYVKIEAIKENANAVLNDFNGKVIASYELKKGNNKLGNDELPKGTYILVLNVDGKQESRQVIIK